MRENDVLKPLSMMGSQHDKTSIVACVHSKDSDQPEHPSSLIGVFTCRYGGGLDP